MWWVVGERIIDFPSFFSGRSLRLRVKGDTFFSGNCMLDCIQLRTDFNLLLMSLLSGELVVACIGIPLDFYAAARLVGSNSTDY